MPLCEPAADTPPWPGPVRWGGPWSIRALLFQLMREGSLPGVRLLLDNPTVIETLDNDETKAALPKARSWRAQAAAYEDLHGPGSLAGEAATGFRRTLGRLARGKSMHRLIG